MAQVIIYTNEYGGVTVCVPTGELPIAQVQAKDVPKNTESFIVDYATLPDAHDEFFDAWEQTNGVITVNFLKAQEITKERLRFERIPLLQAQDIAFQRALETGADTTAIVTEKQRLRDITTAVYGCTTLDELRALHP